MESTLDIRIDELGARGDGVAHSEDGPLYIPYSAPGDLIRARLGKKQGEGFAARIVEVLEEGPERVEPPCRHFGDCGGCALQHIAGDGYLAFKRDLVVSALSKRGFHDVTVDPCAAFEPASRRRAVFKAVNVGSRVLLGFNQAASHKVVDVQACEVVVREIAQIIDPLRRFLGGFLRAREETAVSVLASETGLDVLIAVTRDLDAEARMALAEFAGSQKLARLCVGEGSDPEEIVVRAPPIVEFDGIPLTPPPGAFLQASRSAQKFLTAFTLHHLSGASRVADLFCGCGTFALPLGRDKQVQGFDSDQAMLGAARAASERSAKALDFQATQRDLFRNPLTAREFGEFDGLIFDPPRAGAKEQAREIAASDIPVVVAVSCSPSSFARDARLLVDGGYSLKTVTPVDQFVWSAQVELAAVFEK